MNFKLADILMFSKRTNIVKITLFFSPHLVTFIVTASRKTRHGTASKEDASLIIIVIDDQIITLYIDEHPLLSAED